MPTFRHRLSAARRAQGSRAAGYPSGLGPRRRYLRGGRWHTAAPETPGSDWRQTATTLAGIVSVLLVAAGLFYTNAANRAQQRLTEQGQITDRFTKAVEQLGQSGPQKIDVRLGAVYALERIMRDSGIDHPAVVEVLAAFVRVHTARPSTSRVTPQSTPGPKPSTSSVGPEADIQAALTVLGRRDPGRDRPGARLDLSRSDLAGVRLPTANLGRADLFGTDLAGADLTGASLENADLREASLSRAYLGAAHLAHADLTHAQLVGAHMGGADLREVELVGADLRGVELFLAHLFGADLSAANLSGYYLPDADLSDANLMDVDLHNANLSGADLHGAVLDGANLDGVNLRTAKHLTTEQVHCTHISETTTLPAEVIGPAADAPNNDPSCR
jgi:uncharacterized protein YjbI with pentapeptide repeats